VAAEHVVEQNLQLASAAGAAAVLRTFPLPQGKPEAPLPEGGFVLASPLAGWRAKQWPLDYYAALARRLKSEWNLPLVFDGPASAASEFAKVAGAVPHFSSLAGLIYATRRATAVVGVDSGPMHLAAALGKPGVAIFGPTDPARNGPFGTTLAVLRSPSAGTSYKRRDEIAPSMREIAPDMVCDALAGCLAAARGAGEAR
jgi:heptosyltransferase-1